jgi:peptide chain release factor
MNLNEAFPISPQKLNSLKEKIRRLGINPALIQETFTRGGGKGGQKINKTSNAVQLYYEPLNLTVRSQQERQRSLNRFLALRELVDQIEMAVSPQTSERMKDWNRLRKQKNRRRRRHEVG